MVLTRCMPTAAAQPTVFRLRPPVVPQLSRKGTDHTGDNPFHAARRPVLPGRHALAYKNCFRCHVGTDKKGLAYFKCKETRVAFKIGRNPKRSAERDQAFVVLRHAPATPTLFDAYVPDALTRCNRLPTWKPNAPHTIGRRTPRNQSCQACHGHTDFFLGPDGMAPWEREDNAGVIVPPGSLPKPLKEEA